MALTKRLVSYTTLRVSSYIKLIEMYMCTLYVCCILYCEYTMYGRYNLHFLEAMEKCLTGYRTVYNTEGSITRHKRSSQT